MKLAKKIGIIVGALFGLLLITIVVLPFVVDVDKYRPQIQSTANEHINGKLELGKLTLNLWGQIRVQVEGLNLTDAKNQKVVAAKDVYFQIPVLSIFTGSPILKFVMIAPEVHIVKDKAGKMNAMTLVKTSAAAPGEKAAETPAKPSAPTKLPGIAMRARLGVEIKDANLTFKDLATQLDSKIQGLNLIVRDLSLSRPMEAELWANLDTKMAKTMQINGPLRFKLNVDSKFSGSEWGGSVAKLSASMDDVEIQFGEMFHKRKGVPANAQLVADVSPDAAKLQSSKIKFHNAEVALVGGASGLKGDAINLDVTVTSNEIALKPWNELIPMLATYDLAGSAKLDGKAWGTTTKPQYSGSFQVKDLTAKAPTLKAQPKIEALVKIVTDKVEAMSLTMTAPGTDLRVTGNVASFTAPNINVDVKSSQMDLDQLVDFPKTPAKNEGKSAPAPADKKTAGGKATPTAAAAADDMDKALDPLRENKIAAATRANIQFKFGMLKAKNVKMTNMNGKMSFKDLTFAVDSFGMGLFGGTIKASANVMMKPKTPAYRFSTEVAKLDLKTAVESQFDAFKNTLLGQASFKMDGSGSSFNPEPAKKNITAKGNMRVENAKFATIDVGKVASEAVNKAITSYSDKIAALKGKTVPPPPSKDTEYESVTANFTLANGKFHAPDFFAKVKPNGGVDIKGDTQVGIVDMSLNANWEIIDTYNVTKARDISVNQQGVDVPNIFAEGGNPVKFPISVTGSCLAPNINYGSVPEALGKVAMANIGRAVEARAKAEVSKRVQEELSKKAPPQVQDALKDVKKKFGF